MVAQPGEAGHLLGGEGGFDAAHLLDAGGQGGPQGALLCRLGRRGLRPDGEPVQPRLGGGDLGAGDRVGVLLAQGGRGELAEVGERGLFPYAGGLGAGGERVLAVVRGECAQQQGAGGGGLLDGAAERGQGRTLGVLGAGRAAGGRGSPPSGAGPARRRCRR
ncbi:hypothetical protein GCM10020000_26060 [Streptomyces olivoverticillatus]